MTSADLSAVRSLDELIAAYDSDPLAFRQSLSVHETTPGDGIIVGTTLSPIRLSSKGVADDGYIWAGIARRLKQPGDVLVRIYQRSKGSYISCRVKLGDPEMWKHWREQPFVEPVETPAQQAQQGMNPPQAPQQQYAQQPYQQPYPHPIHTGYQPAPDALGVVLQSMNNQQTIMMRMMEKMNEPRVDPAVEVLKKEIERLTAAMETQAKKDEGKFTDYIELATKAAGGGGGLEAAAKLLAGPLDKVAGSISTGIEKKAEIELVMAQAKLAEAETKQIEAGVKAEAAGMGAHLVEKPQAAPVKTA